MLKTNVECPESHRESQSGTGKKLTGKKSTDDNSALESQFYDATDTKPVSSLVEHLCEVFFTHLGCNYPFLERGQFMQDLRGKKVDGVLVDAICAISARFSTHPMLTHPSPSGQDSNPPSKSHKHKSKHGCAFAKRAMSRVPESFACPSIAAVQACLLLAYEQFGSDRDSGLWVWLGISIRLAQDLGLQKSDNSKRQAQGQLSPKLSMIGAAEDLEEQLVADDGRSLVRRTNSDPSKMTEQELLEKKRRDTFWPVYFLDRYLSFDQSRLSHVFNL